MKRLFLTIILAVGFYSSPCLARSIQDAHRAVIAKMSVGADETAPELSSATVGENGTTLTLVFTENVTQGAGYDDSDWDLDCTTTGQNLALTYVSGDGTGTHVYTIGSEVQEDGTDTCDIDFNGDANSEEDGAGNDLAAIDSGAVTNNSEQGEAEPTLVAHNTASYGSTSGPWTIELTDVSAGDLIVVTFVGYVGAARTVSSVVDDIDGAYTAAYTMYDFDSGGYFEYVGTYYLENSTGGDPTITLTLSDNIQTIYLTAASFSGVATSSALRGSSVTASGSGTTAASGNKTDFTVGDLMVGAFGSDGNMGGTLGAGTGWADVHGEFSGMNMTYNIADATTEAASCTCASGAWGAAIIGFKPE